MSMSFTTDKEYQLGECVYAKPLPGDVYNNDKNYFIFTGHFDMVTMPIPKNGD